VFNAKDYLLNDHSQDKHSETTPPPPETADNTILSSQHQTDNLSTISKEQPPETHNIEQSIEAATEHLAFSSNPSANDEPDESWALKLLKESEQTEAILANDNTDEDSIFAEHEDDFLYEVDDDAPEKNLTEINASNNKSADPFERRSAANTQQDKLVDPTESLFIDIINNDLDDNATAHTENDLLNLPLDETPTIIEPYKQSLATDNDDDSWADDLLVDENSSPDAALIPSDPSTTQLLTDASNTNSYTVTTINTDLKVQVSDDTRNTLSLDFERDSITFPEEKPSSRRWPWAIGSILLIATLFGQSAWVKVDEWSNKAIYRTYYEKACDLIGCKLPERFDITQIRSTHLVVRSHPDQKRALIVDAIIANNAQFKQPFPGIRLLFLDIQGKLVASRVFQPREYVKGDLFGQTVMPANQSIQLSLPIADPGDKAVNYRLEMTPATTKN
jgi:hypothetical protein